MGASTYTSTLKPITVMGNKRVHKVKYVISSYGTDGVPLDQARTGMGVIDAVLGITLRTVVSNGPVCGVWDETNSVVKFHKASNSDSNAGTAFDADVVVMGS